MKEYLEGRIQRTIKDGVTHVSSEFNKKFSDLSTTNKSMLDDWLEEVNRNMIQAESFSLDHMYWWSLSSHLTDIIHHIPDGNFS